MANFTDEGHLRIGTFAVDIGRPASNAVVQVTQTGDDKVIEEMITDISGQTPEINLPAPPLEFSMDPASTEQPYSEYDVKVLMEGYEPQIVKGVQILPHAMARQNINLQPATYPAQQPIVIPIPGHTLWETFPPKIPEDEVKELPPSTGLVVLPEPVVPEFVVVHDGRPNDTNAKRYWVPFADYIKNVASNEIYPTWPTATLTANILAIISFTLNRVYTEWYRSRGYDFTITSSTSFDHKFSYGRNIFDEISQVVDNIFTTFITRPNIRQPLFAQYCDGKKVSCPNWMRQWESKTLGDKGYDAINILKSFYGYDIFLMQAKKVDGVPKSYSGVPLQMGSTGEAVRTIQSQLNTIANNYPAIRKVAVDGIFGEQTRLAVEKFQEIFKLASDGIVGFSTWYKISAIYTAVARLAELT